MKTKKKVTTALIISFAILFVGVFTYIANKEDKENSVEVTKDVDASNLVAESIDETNPNAELIQMTYDVAARGLLETEINIEEAYAIVEEEENLNEVIELDDSIEELDESVEDSIEDVIVTTLSISEPEFTFNKVLPKVSEYLNIRSEAKQDADVVGKLYKNSYAVIVERLDEWTKIKSGSVEGYVSNEYLYFDDDAVAVAKSLDGFKAEVTAGSVNVRTKPTTDCEVLEKAQKGDTFTHVPEMDCEGWIAIRYDDKTIAYLSSEYAKAKLSLKTAVSKAEEEEAEKAAKIAKELQEAKKYQPASTNRKAITVSDEEIFLLATVVAMEAGGESYEGQLAVANVVINRMLDGYWGSTISSVVYAPGQFSGANSGRVEKYSSRVTESNKRAAIEALAGNNNIGNYMYFIMKGRANYSSYKKYYVLGCHCFYSR